MTTPLVTYATHAVPRYTSYPTAPHFSGAIGPKQARAWLSCLDSGTTLSLYLHVPFCRQLCLYCGCNTKMVRRIEPVAAYGETLQREIDLVADILGGRRPVRRIHWGGGTPSMLPQPVLARIVERLAARFDLSALTEHAIELDPRHVTPELARHLASLGIDRVSFGVQDFTMTVQAAIGRIQPIEVVAAAVGAVRAAGITRISFDLMYGLPRQSVEDAARSAALAAELEPQRIALFGYAHVPWFKPHQRLIDEASLPDAETRLAQAAAAHDALVDHGFRAIGLDHFARPDDPLTLALAQGRLRRNFQGYTDDDAGALIGLGASAIGALPQGFLQNAPDLPGYLRAIAAGQLATVKGLALTEDDRLRGDIIERLMCDLEVDVAALCARHETPPEALLPAFDALEPLCRDGLARTDGFRVMVTEAGRPFARLVAAAFDAYLGRGAARHSKAV